MKSVVRVLYFVILQIFWILRSFYEAIMPEKNIKKVDSKNMKEQSNLNSYQHKLCENERRHLIQLFTTEPNQHNGRPVCYMHVCEIITPHEEEMLRCACAKGASQPKATYFKYNAQEYLPPAGRISRATFTNAWMESFSLVI